MSYNFHVMLSGIVAYDVVDVVFGTEILKFPFTVFSAKIWT